MAPEAEFFKPGNDISWLVKQFEVIRCDVSCIMTDKFVPREDAAIVFHFGNLPRILSPVDQVLPPFFIAPLCPTANSIRLEGKTIGFIVICKPTVLSRVLGISMIAGNRIFIPIPEQIFGPVRGRMNESDSPAAKIDIFTEFINNLQQRPYVPDDTDDMYEKIIHSNFSTPLREVISQFKVSERTLQRKFRERLGITPKMLSRITKINYLWNSIGVSERIDYQDLVFLGNYFDQTHFIKDFKAITGETPDHFFRRNLHLAKILSGRES